MLLALMVAIIVDIVSTPLSKDDFAVTVIYS